MGQLVSKAEFADLIGKDERTLSRWQQEGMPVHEFGMGRGNENQYDTAACIAWMCHKASLNGQKETARDRLDRVRAEREELALARELGDVVVAADLVSRYEAMITAAKLELLNTLPDALATALSARHGVDIDDLLIRDHVERVLIALSTYDPDADLDDAPDGPYDQDEAEADGF